MIQGSATRRGLLKGAGALAAGAVSRAKPARAQPRTLRILQGNHFVSAYDRWLTDVWAKEWGGRNDTEVTCDIVPYPEVIKLAKAAIEAGSGHDLVQFVEPAPAYEDHFVDLREVHEECTRRYGPPSGFVQRSTVNPLTGKHFGLCGSYQPALVTYRADLWEGVGAAPDSWADVLTGGRRIRLLHDNRVGLSLAPEHNSAQTMRAILYSFGGAEQDEAGKPALRSPATLEAIKYIRFLYQEAMREDVLGWDAASNNRFMLNGEGSLTLDSISIVRGSEAMGLPIAPSLRLAPVPAGPGGRLAPSFGFFTYVVWRFAENIEGAKRFLADYVAESRASFLASKFQNVPSWPGSIADLPSLIAADPAAEKYALLSEVQNWTTNVGHPGYTTRAIGEIYSRGVISTMFAKAASGRLTPEEALDEADREVARIIAG